MMTPVPLARRKTGKHDHLKYIAALCTIKLFSIKLVLAFTKIMLFSSNLWQIKDILCSGVSS